MAGMRAGELRHYITIERPDDRASKWNNTPDAGRQYVTWAQVWAKISPVRGSETSDAGTKKTQSDITHLIRMRYIRGVTPSMRITYQGRIFKIRVSRDIDERGRELLIEAREETDGGTILDSPVVEKIQNLSVDIGYQQHDFSFTDPTSDLLDYIEVARGANTPTVIAAGVETYQDTTNITPLEKYTYRFYTVYTDGRRSGPASITVTAIVEPD